MKVQHRQRLEITLDIFRGCAHACSGCMIDKSLGGDVSDIPDLHLLIKEMVAAGYVAFDLGMGPTDFMSSENTDEVMQHKEVRAMAQLFHQVTFNAAFLEKDMDKYAEMCEKIDDAVPGRPIRFLIPAAPDFFKTDKFGNMIGKKLEFIRDNLNEAYLNEAGFVVNCTRETMGPDFIERLTSGFDVEFCVDKDDILSIPYGRLKTLDIMTGESVKRVSHQISAFYSTLSGEDERRRNPDLHYDTGTMVNLLYTGGKLYWVPFLKDDYAFLNDAFVIPRPWTMDNLLKARSAALESSLKHVRGTQCESCPHLSSCAEKGITTIMEALNVKDCMVGLQHVH